MRVFLECAGAGRRKPDAAQAPGPDCGFRNFTNHLLPLSYSNRLRRIGGIQTPDVLRPAAVHLLLLPEFLLRMAELIVVGDRVLIRPQRGEQKTDAGLLLPPSVAEQGNVRGGEVVKTGPGYLTQNPEYSESETWKSEETPVRYLPLQAEEGDFAFFVRQEAVQIRYEHENFLIVPHSSILALVREDELSEEKSDTTIEDLDDLLDE